MDWFNYLVDNGLGFCIRSRDYAYFPQVDPGSPKRARLRGAIARVRASRKPNRAKRFPFRFSPGGPRLYFVVARNPDPAAKDRVMYLITTVDQTAYRTVAGYLKRWKVEHCFRHLKTNGFDLELLNLRGPERQRLLIAVAVFAYVVSVVEGLTTYTERVPVRKHGSRGRAYRAVSVFRYGIDRLGEYEADLLTFCRYLVARIKHAMTGYRSAVLLNV